MVKAAKNYSMKPCACCHGNGIGVLASGARWICDNCDGAGKVSVYPIKFVGGSRAEPLLDRG